MDTEYYSSVDSALTLLGNPGTPGVRHWRLRLNNPYYGKNVDFGAFRDSADNSINYNGQIWKLNYLVCRLDGMSQPTENVVTSSFPNGVEVPRDVKAGIAPA